MFGFLLAALMAAAAPVSAAPACASAKTFALGDACATCAGIPVARVRRGLIHGVTVNGVFWTDALRKIYTNHPGGEAETACREKAPWLRLPTKAEVAALAAALHHDWSNKACAGESELNAVMPDNRGRHFWSSSPVEASPDKTVWSYWGTDDSFSPGPRGGNYAVRCIAAPGVAIPAEPSAPVDHAGAAIDVEGKPAPRELSSCVTSLVNDSGVGDEPAAEACKSRWSREFYFCVYHLVNAGGNPAASLESCLLKPAALPATAASDPGKLGRWLSSCTAGNLFGCVLVGKEKAKAGDAAGAKPFFKKACDGGFKPGCDGLSAP